MLLRVDPDRNAIALFSLPRDLKVEIPGFGTAKLNEAYAYGGPELTLKTIKELTKVPATDNEGLEINHIVNVDFEGFARAVNAIGCVYVDVDRRYYHSNDETVEDYEEIDIQPGYQALCGFNALDYARYRHTDNDVVRAARQQDFLREARQKVPPEVIFADRKELIDIFTEHTTSDIDSALGDARGAEAVRRGPRRAGQGGPLRGKPRPVVRDHDHAGDQQGGRAVPRHRGHARTARRDRRPR